MVDYLGGTYISQKSGNGPWDAFTSWHSSLLAEETAVGVTLPLFHALSEAGQDELTPVNEVRNVWCLGGSYEGELLLLNIIKTEA